MCIVYDKLLKPRQSFRITLYFKLWNSTLLYFLRPFSLSLSNSEHYLTYVYSQTQGPKRLRDKNVNKRVFYYRGADKSLARPGKKQATFPAFYGTWMIHYHIHKSPPPVTTVAKSIHSSAHHTFDRRSTPVFRDPESSRKGDTLWAKPKQSILRIYLTL